MSVGFLSICSPILIVGGGDAAEIIRRLDRLHGLGEETCHWLAIRAMSLNSHVLATLLPGSVVVESLQACGGLKNTPILDPLPFMKNDEGGPDRLPHSWSVTSDSIAARVAQAVEAEELILLKSRSAERGSSWVELARRGIVDAYFPTLAGLLRSVRIVNFGEAWQAAASS